MRLGFLHKLAIICGLAFAGFAAQAEETDVFRAIEDVRAGTTDYVYVHGGIFDGAAMGQTTTFIVTPDDQLQCAFVFDPGYSIGTDEEGEFTPEFEVKTWVFEQVIPELYVRLQDGLGIPKNSGLTPVMLDGANYIIEMSQAGNRTWALISWGDRRVEWINDELYAFPQPTECWSWG